MWAWTLFPLQDVGLDVGQVFKQYSGEEIVFTFYGREFVDKSGTRGKFSVLSYFDVVGICLDFMYSAYSVQLDLIRQISFQT